jgi:hypothetical protein
MLEGDARQLHIFGRRLDSMGRCGMGQNGVDK